MVCQAWQVRSVACEPDACQSSAVPWNAVVEADVRTDLEQIRLLFAPVGGWRCANRHCAMVRHRFLHGASLVTRAVEHLRDEEVRRSGEVCDHASHSVTRGGASMRGQCNRQSVQDTHQAKICQSSITVCNILALEHNTGWQTFRALCR
jgi:hypothetical protein